MQQQRFALVRLTSIRWLTWHAGQHLIKYLMLHPHADDTSAAPADAAETWTFGDHLYTITTSKFATAEAAQEQCKEQKGHLVHFIAADQLTASFNHLNIDIAPGKGTGKLANQRQERVVEQCCKSQLVPVVRHAQNPRRSWQCSQALCGQANMKRTSTAARICSGYLCAAAVARESNARNMKCMQHSAFQICPSQSG